MINFEKETKVYELKTCGKTNLIKLLKTNYIMAPDKLAVQMFCWDEEYKFWEPWSTLTVNTGDQPLNKNCAFINTNNNKDIIGWMIKNGMGRTTKRFSVSGFCTYPEFEFNDRTLSQMANPRR